VLCNFSDSVFEIVRRIAGRGELFGYALGFGFESMYGRLRVG